MKPTPTTALPPRTSRALVTSANLSAAFDRLGVRKGGVVVVHSSISALGYLVHGVSALRLALERALGAEGTLLVPTFTGEQTDPACWVEPALPSSVWNEVRDSMPSFDKRRSMPRSMGQLALSVLMDPRCERSDHPLCSFAAIGPRAAELTAAHDLRDPFGPLSPLGRTRSTGGQILLIGVDQRRNSAIAHAQCCADGPQVRRAKATFLAEVDGQRQWVTPTRLAECSEGYQRIEDELTSRGLVRVARAGDGLCRLMSFDPFVCAVEHLLRLDPLAVRCQRPTCRQCA